MGPGIARKFSPSLSLSLFFFFLILSLFWGLTIYSNNLGAGPPTNVSRLSGAVAHKCCSGMPQIVYYHPGAGTEASKVATALGGAFGIGVAQDIVESYRFICDNYNPGDEIIIIGFSRGAFTARSVAAMVCALGFLNRSGMDQLPYIFHDYETWQRWGNKNNTKFNEKDHLVGFTVENVKKLRRFKAASQARAAGGGGGVNTLVQPGQPKKAWELWGDAELETKLLEWKKQTFAHLASQKQRGANGKEIQDLRVMAGIYRELLADFQLSLCERQVVSETTSEFKYVPVKGHIKAVGVWDTVGSLGIPEIPPFYHSGRGEHEIRFESLDVHPRIEHAFHAIALDEWRTAFDCTMWGKRDNDTTNLRQVWFPGTHCNVGGGWEDQQIATIALAWMADQLTSVGVEFSKSEMNRIFYELRGPTRARPWGLGMIHNPNGATSYPDWLWSYVAAPWRKYKHGTTDYVTRTPGGYKEDNGILEIVSPNELVHPCVRLRYLYGGLNMDDAGPWTCRPLTERGFTLQRRTEPPFTTPRGHRIPSALNTYHTVRGPVTPYYDSPPELTTATATATSTVMGIGSESHPFVRAEQPHEEELYPLPSIPSGSDSGVYWAWVHPDGDILYEEQIGMWERLFIKVNEKLLTWQAKRDASSGPPGGGEVGVKKGVWESVTVIFGGGGGGGGGGEKKKVKTKAEELGEGFCPPVYGFHGFFTWQRGDMSVRKK